MYALNQLTAFYTIFSLKCDIVSLPFSLAPTPFSLKPDLEAGAF